MQSSQQETIIVTASYTPAPLDDCDRTVDVIETNQSPTLFRSWADVLRLDSSIDLRERSPGTQGDLSIRGSSFGQTLVLVDGIRVNDAQSGHHNLDLPVPFESIERVEVLHGSGSTLYGSDAVGGAVNFITAAPVASELRLGAGVGNFGTNTQNGAASYLAKNWSEQLTFTRDSSSGFMPDRDYRNSGSDNLWAARWSPDGRYLVARSIQPLGLMLYDFRTKAWSRIANDIYVGAMSWSSDSRHLYFLRRGSDPAILRVRIADATILRVADLKGVRQTGFRNGFWLGLTPDDAPLILQDIGTEEIYSLDLTTE